MLASKSAGAALLPAPLLPTVAAQNQVANVTVPEGLVAGDKFQCEVGGVLVELAVPEGECATACSCPALATLSADRCQPLGRLRPRDAAEYPRARAAGPATAGCGAGHSGGAVTGFCVTPLH